VGLSIPAMNAFGYIEYDIDRCLSQPIDQARVPSELNHFMTIALENIPNGFDRFFCIELFQKIDRLIFPM
jgi:hypothetical protein